MGLNKGLSPETLHKLKEIFKLSLIKLPQYNHISIKDAIVRKAYAINNSYKKFTGIDELDKYQERVTSLQDQLLTAQDDRRKIGHELSDLRRKSNELQDQLQRTQRHENLQRYLDLVRDETEILKHERVVSERFNNQDRLEREIFTAFTNAIRDSQEKQRTRMEYAKYWGLLLGVVGSLASYVITSIRTQDLKQLVIKEMRDHNEPIISRFDKMPRLIGKQIEESSTSLLEGVHRNGRKLDIVYDAVSGRRSFKSEHSESNDTGVVANLKYAGAKSYNYVRSFYVRDEALSQKAVNGNNTTKNEGGRSMTFWAVLGVAIFILSKVTIGI